MLSKGTLMKFCCKGIISIEEAVFGTSFSRKFQSAPNDPQLILNSAWSNVPPSPKLHSVLLYD